MTHWTKRYGDVVCFVLFLFIKSAAPTASHVLWTYLGFTCNIPPAWNQHYVELNCVSVGLKQGAFTSSVGRWRDVKMTPQESSSATFRRPLGCRQGRRKGESFLHSGGSFCGSEISEIELQCGVLMTFAVTVHISLAVVKRRIWAPPPTSFTVAFTSPGDCGDFGQSD